MDRTIGNDKLRSYSGFLNALMVSITPHTFSDHFDPGLVGDMLEIPPTAVNKVVETFCNLLVIGEAPSKIKDYFRHRPLLCTCSKMFSRLSGEVPISTYRHSSYSSFRSHSRDPWSSSSIDQLKLRYCHTYQDYKRLQNK